MDLLPLISVGYVALLSIPLALIDIREHRLPNPMTLSAIAVSALLLSVDAIIRTQPLQLAVAASLAGLTWGVGYLMAYRELIGMGDVKLLTALHLILGYVQPWLVLISLTLSFTMASIVSLAQVALKRKSLQSFTAMGPFLLVGFFGTIALGFTGAA